MTLMAGRGPLSADPEGWFTPAIPDAVVFVEPHHRRVRARIDGSTVIDTEDVLMVHRRGHALSYAFREDQINGIPTAPVDEAPGYVYVSWDSVDEWFEEGRKLVDYPPNPYHRVDCLPTERGLRVSIDDVVLVDTVDTVVLFETGAPPRLYVDPALVRTDVLHRSDSTSYCNYKGYATYWSAAIGDRVVDDVAWSYSDPLPESTLIRNLLSFDETKVDMLAEVADTSNAAGDCGCAV